MDNTRPALEGIQRPANILPVPPGTHRDVAHPIPVRARLAFSAGDEWVDGLAMEWTRELVRVSTTDPRLHPRVVWVRAGDVVRG